MITGIGTDIVDINRIAKLIDKYDKKILDRLFTETEQEYSESFNYGKYQHYAARFAAKESFSKAIGTGMTENFKFREIGIVNEENGRPRVVLDGALKEKYGGFRVHVSLSHTDSTASAYIIMEKED